MVAPASMVVVLVVAACSGGGATPSPVGQPTATPDIEATVSARVRGTVQAVRDERPGATAPARLGRETVLGFTRSHRSIEADWEELHTDFDRWRHGLVVCDASTVQDTLRGFAGRFAALPEQARSLPDRGFLREVGEQITEALEQEGTALRQLRDAWQPDAVEPFEALERERSAGASLRRQAEGTLADLTEKTSALVRADVAGFAQAVREIDQDWQQYRRAYEEFRQEQPALSADDTASQLGQLVVRFLEIVTDIRDLPASKFTRPLAQTLAQAAEQEDLALKTLRDAVREAEAPGPPPDTDPDEEADPPARPAPEPLPFLEFDTQLVQSDGLRRQAAEALADLLDDTSQEKQAAVKALAEAYQPLAEAWDTFYQDYDAWRRTDGGCDRSEAVETLGQFVTRFGSLSGQVRALPRVTPLRPLGELLVEAAEGEERALLDLRNSWVPFDASVYRSFDRERGAANKLRRQVVAGVNDLLAEFNIAPGEVSS